MHDEAIRRVGEALAARHAELAEAMVERIVAEVPAYRRARREVIDDVLVLSTATSEILAQAFASGAGVRREDVPIVREHAALRLRQGVSLEAFLHAYRAALFGYWDACAEEATRLGISKEASLALARFAFDAIDTITTHAAEAYLREDARLRAQGGREARDLVERLIGGQPVGDDRRHPAAPGLAPGGPLVVVVGRVDRADGRIADVLQAARDALEESLALGASPPLLAIRQGEIVAIAAGDAAARLRMARRRVLDEHDVDVRFGAALAPAGFASVPRAYREAVLSLSYTSAVRPVVSLEELSSLECALVGADATTRAILTAKSGVLRDLPAEDLATIRAFSAADLNVSRAAQDLHVHPNTVRYRLGRIAASTGQDPRTFAGLVELVCGVEMLTPTQ
jgi:hypothetical protein